MSRFMNGWITAIALIISGHVYAGQHTYTWKVLALDEDDVTSRIAGVEVNFSITNNGTGSVTPRFCTTGADGECSVQSEAKTGFFSNYSSMQATFTIKKPGYSENFKTRTEKHGSQVLFYILLKSDASEQRKRDLENEVRSRVMAEQSTIMSKLKQAEALATVSCRNKASCDKLFALTEIYIAKTASMRIDSATPSTIQTFNPTEPFKVGMHAFRVPGKGESAVVTITAMCKEPAASPLIIVSSQCFDSLSGALLGFRPFIDKQWVQ